MENIQNDTSSLEPVSTMALGENHAVTELDDERFSLWSVLGVQYTTSATPLSICGFMQFTLGVGGSPFFFWCFLVAVFLQGLVIFSFAELGSAYPHVAGTSRLKFCHLLLTMKSQVKPIGPQSLLRRSTEGSLLTSTGP